MKRHIKFPLFMKDNIPVRTMEELRNHYDVWKLQDYFANGRLAIWLRDRYEDELCESIEELDPKQNDFMEQLCRILGVRYVYSEQRNWQDVLSTIERRKQIQQYTNRAEVLDSADSVAFTQEELESIAEKGTADVIWLIGEQFELPAMYRKVTLCGVNAPRIILNAKSVNAIKETKSELKDIGSAQFENTDLDADLMKILMLTDENVGETRTFAGMDWTVLSYGSNEIMMISQNSVNSMPHTTTRNDNLDWSSSDIREWLNHEFLSEHFTDTQKEMLVDKNGDYVSILSTSEAIRYRDLLYAGRDEDIWLRDKYEHNRFIYFYIMRITKESCDIKETTGKGSVNDILKQKAIRPIIFVRNLTGIQTEGR